MESKGVIGSSSGFWVWCRIVVTMDPRLRIGTVPKDRRNPEHSKLRGLSRPGMQGDAEFPHFD